MNHLQLFSAPTFVLKVCLKGIDDHIHAQFDGFLLFIVIDLSTVINAYKFTFPRFSWSQLAHLGPVVQHSITSKRNRQAQKSLENNEPLYYLQELSKDVERYNYIKVKQTLCKFSLFIYLPKSSYSLAASSSLSSAAFSPKPVNFLPKTPCPLFPSSESVIFF